MSDKEPRCICCGLPVSASEWCMETRDGNHRPTIPCECTAFRLLMPDICDNNPRNWDTEDQPT